MLKLNDLELVADDEERGAAYFAIPNGPQEDPTIAVLSRSDVARAAGWLLRLSEEADEDES